MKLKSLLFGSAAVLAAGTGAQAADLPTVEPVEYVRICDAFGTGYYYIPGTDTCLKVGGYVRAESHYVDGDVDVFYGRRSNGLQQSLVSESEVNNWTTRVRGQINLDARTQTDFGLVRAYIAIEMQVGHDNVTEGDTSPLDDEIGGSPNYPGTSSNLAAAFIQISNNWGTYTAGRTGSFFDFWGSHGYGTRLNIDDSTTDTNLFAWTFAGGNGISFTVAAEDPASNGRRRNGDDDYEGQEAPDGVANIRIDQGWGSAQVMGAVRHIHDVNGDGIGFAVGAGVGIGIPGGWRIDAQGGYSEGAIAYITTDPGAIGDFNGPDGDDTNEAWSVRAGITGPLFNPNLEVWLDGSYTEAEEDDGGDDYEFWAIKAGARWSPVAGLGIGPEFAYLSFDGDDGTDPVAPIDFFDEDFDVWGVMWRIQRSF